MRFLKKNRIVLFLLLIVLLGAFLRTYHFSDWLHFELDQSRDAKIVDLAIKEGPQNLPLLGPKAAGSFLRLGPAFYYFKYLSAIIFGNTPAGIAAIIPIFGILAIWVFYLFLDRYFEKRISLGLTLLFSVSIFLVMYSRFSWNPNPLPLFTILTFYALLRLADKDEKRKGVWLLVSAFSLGIATQLHFLAFVAVPAISFLFLVIKRPRIKVAYWALAVLIEIILYSPAIINDVKTGGDNIGQFMEVAKGKSEKSDHNIAEKAFRNYSENSLGHFLILSGRGNAELPKVATSGNIVSCDQGCKDRLALGALAFIIFSLGIAGTLWRIIKIRSLEERKKDFVIMIGVWFVVVFGLYAMISFDISPRFFLLISALPFVFWGFLLETVIKKWPKYSLAILIVAFATPAISNAVEIGKRFGELDKASRQSFDISADKILKERTRVTLAQQYMIIDYISEVYGKNGYPVYINSEPFYRRSFGYHLDSRNIPHDDFRNASNSHKVYRNGNYFLIYPTESNLEADIKKYSQDYEVAEKKYFGTLTAIRLSPLPGSINAEQQEFELEGKSKSAPGVPVRYKWEEIFDSSSKDEEESN